MSIAMRAFREICLSNSEMSKAWNQVMSGKTEGGECEKNMAHLIQSFATDTWKVLEKRGLSTYSKETTEELLWESVNQGQISEKFVGKQRDVVNEMVEFTFARLGRISKTHLGIENSIFVDDVLLFEDERIFYPFIFSYLAELRNYLQNKRSMIILTEGRSAIDSLYERLCSIGELSGVVGVETSQFLRLHIEKKVELYFYGYRLDMNSFDSQQMDWSYLGGFVGRLHDISQKLINRSPRVAIAYHSKSMKKILESVLQQMPEVKNPSQVKIREKNRYEKMIRGLLSLKNMNEDDGMGLEHVKK